MKHIDQVIVEGFEHVPIHRSKFYRRFIEDCVSQDYKCGGELVLTSQLSLRAGIPVYGGEPSDAEIWKYCSTKLDITKEEFIDYYLVRQVSQWLREGYDDKALLDMISEFLSSMSHQIAFDPEHERIRFLRWFRGEGFDLRFDSKEINFLLSESRFETIAHEITNFRDIFLSEIIRRASKNHGTTLISYGANHQLQLSKFISKLCGRPIEILDIKTHSAP